MVFPTLAKYLAIEDNERRANRFGELVHSYDEGFAAYMGNIGLTPGMVYKWVEKSPPPADSEAFNKLLDAAKDVTENLRDIRYVIFEDPGLWRPPERWVPYGISEWEQFFFGQREALGNRVDILESKLKSLAAAIAEVQSLLKTGQLSATPPIANWFTGGDWDMTFEKHVNELKWRLDSAQLEAFYAERLKDAIE